MKKWEYWRKLGKHLHLIYIRLREGIWRLISGEGTGDEGSLVDYGSWHTCSSGYIFIPGQGEGKSHYDTFGTQQRAGVCVCCKEDGGVGVETHTTLTYSSTSCCVRNDGYSLLERERDSDETWQTVGYTQNLGKLTLNRLFCYQTAW